MRDRWGRSVEPCGRAHLPGSHDRNSFQLPAPKTPPTAYLRDPVASLPWLTSGAPQSERGQSQSTAQRHDAQQGDGRVKCLPNPRPRALSPARHPYPRPLVPSPAPSTSTPPLPHTGPSPARRIVTRSLAGSFPRYGTLAYWLGSQTRRLPRFTLRSTLLTGRVVTSALWALTAVRNFITPSPSQTPSLFERTHVRRLEATWPLGDQLSPGSSTL